MSSFQRWVAALEKHSASAAVRQELPYWASPARAQAPRLPIEVPDGSRSEAALQRASGTLSVEDTRAFLANLQSRQSGKLPVDREDRTILVGPRGNIAIRIVRPTGAQVRKNVRVRQPGVFQRVSEDQEPSVVQVAGR